MAALTIAALAAVGAELALAYRAPAIAPDEWEAETNAALVARFYEEVWNGGELTGLTGYIADGHAVHDPAAPDAPAGPDGVAEIVAGLRQAFPDLTLTLDDVVTRRDRVVVRFTARGAHRGTILGAEATGSVVTVTGVAVHHIADRQIVETWMNWDTYGLAQQVGLFLLPAPDDGSWDGAPGPIRPGKPH